MSRKWKATRNTLKSTFKLHFTILTRRQILLTSTTSEWRSVVQSIRISSTKHRPDCVECNCKTAAMAATAEAAAMEQRRQMISTSTMQFEAIFHILFVRARSQFIMTASIFRHLHFYSLTRVDRVQKILSFLLFFSPLQVQCSLQFHFVFC